MINDLASEAARRGFKVTVLTQQPSYPQGRMPSDRLNHFFSNEKWEGVEILRIKTVLGYKGSLFYKLFNYLWFAGYATLIALLIRRRFDRVFIYQTGPLTMAIPGLFYGKIRHVPVAIWTQDVWPDSVYAYGFRKTSVLSRSLDIFVAWVYRSATVVLISCKGFERVLGNYTDKQMIYAPNWPLFSFKHLAAQVVISDIPIFLFAGNIGKIQNLENVIKGFAIASRNTSFRGILRIVGDGSALESLRILANKENVKVDFPGRIHSSAMQEEYEQAQFLVMSLIGKPAFRLTVPSKFQMYVSVGKPMLCAAEGEVRNLVREFDLGVDADADSPTSIAAAFIRLSETTGQERERWRSNAILASSSVFDQQQIINSIIASIDTMNVAGDF